MDYVSALKTITRSDIAGRLKPIALRAVAPKVRATPRVRPVISQEVFAVVLPWPVASDPDRLAARLPCSRQVMWSAVRCPPGSRIHDAKGLRDRGLEGRRAARHRGAVDYCQRQAEAVSNSVGGSLQIRRAMHG